jgi:hypothetical protein
VTGLKIKNKLIIGDAVVLLRKKYKAVAET